MHIYYNFRYNESEEKRMSDLLLLFTLLKHQNFGPDVEASVCFDFLSLPTEGDAAPAAQSTIRHAKLLKTSVKIIFFLFSV
jgi:hypothetical protein